MCASLCMFAFVCVCVCLLLCVCVSQEESWQEEPQWDMPDSAAGLEGSPFGCIWISKDSVCVTAVGLRFPSGLVSIWQIH